MTAGDGTKALAALVEANRLNALLVDEVARTPLHDLPDLSKAARSLLAACAVELAEPAERGEWIAKGPTIAVLCPAGTTFDAAEALRLELVAKVPSAVCVDVQIAPSPPGTLTPEDEAGARLFASRRAKRLAPKPPDDEAFPWDEPEGGA